MRLIKRLLKIVGVLVIVSIVGTIYVLNRGGAFRKIEPHFAGNCESLPLDASAEDMTVDRERGFVYISIWTAVPCQTGRHQTAGHDHAGRPNRQPSRSRTRWWITCPPRTTAQPVIDPRASAAFRDQPPVNAPPTGHGEVFDKSNLAVQHRERSRTVVQFTKRSHRSRGPKFYYQRQVEGLLGVPSEDRIGALPHLLDARPRGRHDVLPLRRHQRGGAGTAVRSETAGSAAALTRNLDGSVKERREYHPDLTR